MNPLSTLQGFWSRVGLIRRLIVALGLLLLLAATVEMFLGVRNDADAYRTQHLEQAKELSLFLVPLLAEHAVIGDYATIRQILKAQVHDRAHVARIDWIGANGRRLLSEESEAESMAPRWFSILAGIPPLETSSKVVLGGTGYGEVVILISATAAENALWSQFIKQAMERSLMIAILFLTIILVLRGNLVTVKRLAEGADRFSHGELDVRIPAQGAPEVRAAARAFNNLAEQIGTLLTNLSENRKQIQEQLHFTHELIDALPNPIFFKNRDGVYLSVNKAWEALFGVSRTQIVGRHSQSLATELVIDEAWQDTMVRSLSDTQVRRGHEVRISGADGALHHMIFYTAIFTTADGVPDGQIGMLVDITEHKEAQAALLRSQGRLAEAQRIARLGNWEWNIVANDMIWSDEVYRIFDLPDLTRVSFEFAISRVHFDDRQFVLDAVDRALHEHQPFSIECRILQSNQAECVVHAQGEAAFDANGKPLRMIGTVQDITERKQTQDRLSYLAYYDPLTGLPNRSLLLERMQQAMQTSHSAERLMAVMFLDLDRFKFINDTLGHDIGDALLKMAAERISALLRPGDTVSRYGGDEFTIVLANVAHVDDVTRIAQKILERFEHSFRVGGRDLFVTSSIGITLYPLDDSSLESLLKNADAAMYHAKEQGRNTFQFYTAEMNMRAARRLSIETGLRNALARNELVLYYQPQIDLKSGAITGVEALLRWQSPEFGSVSPAEFVPLAEEIGLIGSIGEWVLRSACQQARVWHDSGFSSMRISVNLSARQLQQQDLVKVVRRVLSDTGLESRYLDLELTESMLMHDMEHTVSTLSELDALGATLSVDDFGTGYSSLSYLKRFPIHVLKIDRSFVRDITSDRNDAAITTAIIAMAHSLGIKVIAEGVETREQQEFLKRHGCDGMQGFYFSKPLPAEDLTRLLETTLVPRGARAGLDGTRAR